ncbi:MAG: DUF6252 family protein [Sediminibacterium sp.]|nr:DUF6252 family protein [Sediminibacterium sp.]
MKSFLIIAASFVLLSSSCRKNKPVNPIDQLPPETQTGANTFGCLVDGEVFKPGGASLTGGSLSCNYQYLGTGPSGGYFFRLAAISRNNNSGESKSIGLFTDSLKILQGGEYKFIAPRIKESAYALYGYTKDNPITIDDYETNNLNTGKLQIKKLDTINQIVSGTFWFDAVNANGQKVQIREGRFDVRYTR